MRARGEPIVLPPCCAPHLVGYLMDMGPIEPSGMGVGPISEQTLYFWQQRSLVQLQPWQGSVIRAMSKAYASEMQRAKTPGCPPPWGEITVGQRKVVSSKIRAIFGGLARNKAEG